EEIFIASLILRYHRVRRVILAADAQIERVLIAEQAHHGREERGLARAIFERREGRGGLPLSIGRKPFALPDRSPCLEVAAPALMLQITLMPLLKHPGIKIELLEGAGVILEM